MLNTLFLLQYSFLNGYLLHRFSLRDKESNVLEIFLSSLFLSWCLNSLVIYILARLFEMPFTKMSVIIVSFSLTLIIFFASFFHSDRNPSLEKSEKMEKSHKKT
jgi:membrane protein implicated in regulation of membrane protease activity